VTGYYIFCAVTKRSERDMCQGYHKCIENCRDKTLYHFKEAIINISDIGPERQSNHVILFPSIVTHTFPPALQKDRINSNRNVRFGNDR
jgi:hypothetical protein